MPNLERVNANESPWHLLGAAMRHWRTEVGEGLSLRSVAARAFVDSGDLSKWERGLTHPHLDAVSRIDDVLKAEGQLVALRVLIEELERAQTAMNAISDKRGDEEVERRRLLFSAAASAGLGMLHTVGGEPIRQLAEMSMGEPRHVDDWHLTVVDHLHAIRTRAPAQVAPDLVVDLLALQHQIDRAGPGTDDLQRVFAMLGAFHASVLIRLGENGPALRWYRTARAAADASGDLNLALHIRAHEAEHTVYGLRPVVVVLAMTDNALQTAGTHPSSGAALLHRSRAHALSRLNRHDEALTGLRTLQELAVADLPEVPGFWEVSGTRIPFSESLIHSRRGDEENAAKARERIAPRPESREILIDVSLHQALCLVKRGAVDEGANHATAVLDSCPTKHRNHLVLEHARSVLEAIPGDKRHRPAVGTLRHMLAASA